MLALQMTESYFCLVFLVVVVSNDVNLNGYS